MAKIDELLQELCPDGVEWKTIKELFETRNGYTPSTKNSSFWTNGDIPWFKMEDIRDKGHILSDAYSHITKSALKGKGLFKANSIILATSATIGEHALITVDHLSNQRFTNIYPKEKWVNKIHMKFVYYYMYLIDEWCKTHVKQGSFAAVDMDGFYKQEIPIPPLSIQQEIVEVLDTFTDAISNLEEELALREKQFEYYREQLLAFDDEDIDKAELSSISDIKGRIGFRGYTRNDIVDKGAGAISLSPSNIVDGMLHFENSTYISWEKYEESPEIKASEGQIVLTKTGSTVGKVALIKYLPEPCTINPQLVLITCTTFNSAYLNYVLQSFSMQSEIKRLAGIGAVPNISQKLLGKIIVPIPSSERQQEIVEILDTFEAMIANIKEEIALRTKQYEYYREKLLSFGK